MNSERKSERNPNDESPYDLTRRGKMTLAQQAAYDRGEDWQTQRRYGDKSITVIELEHRIKKLRAALKLFVDSPLTDSYALSEWGEFRCAYCHEGNNLHTESCVWVIARRALDGDA